MIRGEFNMWYDHLSNNKFLIGLYSHVPDLNNIRIEELAISREGDKMKLVFDMPKFVDNIPEKWLKAGKNAVTIELNFWNIYNLKIDLKKIMGGNIKIKGEEKGDLLIFLDGNMHCEFNAEFGMIQKIEGYIKE